jgi:hypothetical protein
VSSSARARPLVLYAVAFGLMLSAGVAIVVSARGFLASTRLLWLSVGFSVAAIVVAAVAIVWRRREP